MHTFPAHIRWTCLAGFRNYKWAEIIGVKMVRPAGLPSRLCFEVVYPDGFVDYIPVSDSENYEIAQEDLK
jgi:hypothetical protein